MRAVVQDRYGPPEVLRIEEAEGPVPKDDQVLARIHATTVTQSDTHICAPDPFLWRLFAGLRRPRWRTLGVEFAGVVEAVGPARRNKPDGVFLKELIEAGAFRAVIDRRHPMEQVVEAHRYVETWQKTGNVVLTISHDG